MVSIPLFYFTKSERVRISYLASSSNLCSSTLMHSSTGCSIFTSADIEYKLENLRLLTACSLGSRPENISSVWKSGLLLPMYQWPLTKRVPWPYIDWMAVGSSIEYSYGVMRTTGPVLGPQLSKASVEGGGDAGMWRRKNVPYFRWSVMLTLSKSPFHTLYKYQSRVNLARRGPGTERRGVNKARKMDLRKKKDTRAQARYFGRADREIAINILAKTIV